jgi:type IV secretion system protein VirB1
MLDFLTLAQHCAPTVAPHTLAAIVRVESTYNPYAIGVVGGKHTAQPKNKTEAIATMQALEKNGQNFSVGIAQINRIHFQKYKLTSENAFDPCTNLHAGSKILEDCYVRAQARFTHPQDALTAAFSCYYSGNFSTGFKAGPAGKPSYVQRVLASADIPEEKIQKKIENTHSVLFEKYAPPGKEDNVQKIVVF